MYSIFSVHMHSQYTGEISGITIRLHVIF